jgi:predicted GNAT superfamily acetyltransferase
MSLRADSLKTNPNKIKAIMKEVKAILEHVDEELKAAYDRDDCKANVTVPITFAIPYMSNRNAQRVIYYKILESLLDRGYDVKIYMTTDQTIFIIKWLSEDEEKDIEQQNTLLAKHTIAGTKSAK